MFTTLEKYLSPFGDLLFFFLLWFFSVEHCSYLACVNRVVCELPGHLIFLHIVDMVSNNDKP